MKKIELFIDHVGRHSPSNNWKLQYPIRMSRLYYILSGSGAYISNSGVELPLLPEHLYLFPYNMPQHFKQNETNPIDHIFFDFISTPPIIGNEVLCYPVSPNTFLASQLDSLRLFINKCTDSYLYKLKFGKIGDAPKNSVEETEQILYSMLFTLLCLMNTEKEIPFIDDPVINDTIIYIQQHYAEALTITELAKQAGYEENYFIRRFRQACGQTPYAYLHSFRLFIAKGLIESGMSAKDVCTKIRYENTSSLSRALHGMKP